MPSILPAENQYLLSDSEVTLQSLPNTQSQTTHQENTTRAVCLHNSHSVTAILKVIRGKGVRNHCINTELYKSDNIDGANYQCLFRFKTS